MVSLLKNQKISLEKASGNQLTKIAVGLGWDPIQKKSGFLGGIFGGSSADIDLDASVLMLDSYGNEIDCAWFGQLRTKCGSLQHRGDNLTGDGDGDDEVIDIHLDKLPTTVKFLAITVNSFRGQNFNEVENAFCRVFDTQNNNKEICHFKLNEQGSHSGVLIAALTRMDADWEFTALGIPCSGRTVESMIPTIRQILVK